MLVRISRIFQGLCIFLASLLITGYQLYHANQVLVLPLVQSTANPILYPNDPFVATLKNYAAPVWRLIGETSRLIPYETTIFILFILTRGLVLIGAAYLSWTISRNIWTAAVGGMAFFALWPSPLIGHGTLVQNYFDHTSLSVAFILLGIAAFYAKKTYYWAIWIGIGFNLNSMYGTYALVYFAATFILLAQYRSKWTKWLLPSLLLLLLISPTVFITASAFSIGAIDNALWIRASEVRFPYHLYPLTWQPIQFVILLVFIIFYLYLMYHSRKSFRNLYQHNLVWLGVSIFWLAFAFFAAYVVAIPPLLVLHPARGTDLWYAFAVISTISVLGYLVVDHQPVKRTHFFFFFFSILWYYLFDHTSLTIAILAGIALITVISPVYKWFRNDSEQLKTSSLVMIVVLLFGLASIPGLATINKTIDPLSMLDPQIREIAEWARENTSSQDQFLVDPNWGEFRALSQRPVYVTWKDGSAILWERSYVSEWVDRIDSLGYSIFEDKELELTPGSIELLTRRYNRLRDENVTQITKQHPISYWVVRANIPSSFPEVFHSSEFKVLQVSPDSD